MPNNDELLDELVDDIIALGTDHANGAFPDGKKPDGTYAPQSKTEALTALHSYIEKEKREARHDEVQAANLVPLEDLPGYIANRMYEFRAALRDSQDGKEG